MNLAGDRVIIRRAGKRDEEMLRHLIDDPETVKVTGKYPRPMIYNYQIHWFCGSAGDVRGIIARKERPEAGLGIILLSHVDPTEKTAEIYIKLTRPARGKGYGRDAVTVLVSHAFFGMGLNHIRARILKNNRASIRLFETCGFKEESACGCAGSGDGENRTVCVYGISLPDGE